LIPILSRSKWDLKDPQRQTLWGAPAPKSWFEQGSVFDGAELRESDLKAQPIVAP
jgi:catechol 2,3-dioxygenase